MPRRKYLEGTDACDKLRVDLPFIEDFCDRLEKSLNPTHKINSRDLFPEYVAYVQQRSGGNKGAVFNANREQAFYKYLANFCDVNGIKGEEDRFKPAGYYMILHKCQRIIKEKAEAATALDVFSRSDFETWTSADKREHHYGYLKILFVGESCGFSTFSRIPIPAMAIVCEYLGENITIEEGERRQQIYKDWDWTSTMLEVRVYGEPEHSIDGHAIDFRKRIFFQDFQNPAKFINSNISDVNLKRKVINGRVFLYAAHDIPANQELFWDYKIPQGPDQPKWYTAPSKYQPKPKPPKKSGKAKKQKKN